MKKVCSFALCITLLATVLLMSGCSSANGNENTLYQQGISMVKLIKEMTENESYIDAMTGSSEIQEHLEGISPSAPEEPKAVYEIKMDDAVLLSMLNITETSGMSEELKSLLVAKAYAAVASQLNAMGGAELLAASSICMASSSAVQTGSVGNILYLYTYENAAPVMVAFTVTGENIVNATASPILAEEFKAVSAEDIKQYFEGVPVEVIEVHP